MSVKTPDRTTFAAAVRRLGRILVIVALVCVVGEAVSAVVFEVPLIVLANTVGVTLALLVVLWGSLKGAATSPGSATTWIVGAYPVQIGVVILFLHVPRMLGVEVRFPALWALGALMVATVCEVFVIATMRQFNVDSSTKETV